MFQSYLLIDPDEEIRFTYTPNSNIMSSINLTNQANTKLMFRVNISLS